jgi:hypothetical protein
MSNKKDKGVLALTGVLGGIDLVNQRIADLKHIQESVYKTTGKISGFANKIQDETNISELIKMYSSVAGRAASYNAAAKDLELTTVPVFKLEGSTVKEYKHDVQLRIAIIANKETLDELNAIKKEYTELMDKEDRMALLAKRLEKFGGEKAAE